MEQVKVIPQSRNPSPGILKPPRGSRPTSLILDEEFLRHSEFKNDLAQIAAEYKAMQLKVELLNSENEGLRSALSHLQQITSSQNTTLLIDTNPERYRVPLTVMAFGFITALVTIVVLFFIQRHVVQIHGLDLRPL